jgi:hypothetical protein
MTKDSSDPQLAAGRLDGLAGAVGRPYAPSARAPAFCPATTRARSGIYGQDRRIAALETLIDGTGNDMIDWI